MQISKIICATFCIGALLFTGVKTFNYKNHQNDKLDKLNLQALTDDEYVGNRVYCYSESILMAGYTYWDCGYCQRYEGYQGINMKSTCLPR